MRVVFVDVDTERTCAVRSIEAGTKPTSCPRAGARQMNAEPIDAAADEGAEQVIAPKI